MSPCQGVNISVYKTIKESVWVFLWTQLIFGVIWNNVLFLSVDIISPTPTWPQPLCWCSVWAVELWGDSTPQEEGPHGFPRPWLFSCLQERRPTVCIGAQSESTSCLYASTETEWRDRIITRRPRAWKGEAMSGKMSVGKIGSRQRRERKLGICCRAEEIPSGLGGMKIGTFRCCLPLVLTHHLINNTKARSIIK